jgi:lysophospholipase L1-like esterase
MILLRRLCCILAFAAAAATPAVAVEKHAPLPTAAAVPADKHAVPSMDGGIEKIAARCEVPADLLKLNHPLPVVSRRLAQGRQLTIVALGASSTQGVGASSAAASYPARLEVELHALFPHMAISVFNKGVGGDDAGQMLARFERDVLSIEPDLLIWQAGVNAALKNWPLDQFVESMTAGIERAHAAGIDVMLMGPQNAPAYVNAPHRREFSDHMMLLSRVKDVPIFPRFRAMTHWMASGAFRPNEIVQPDGLHMTDASYYCLARLVARFIAAAAPSPDMAARLAR